MPSRKVAEIVHVDVPNEKNVIDLVLECGHKMRRYDPGTKHAFLRPKVVYCFKCDRKWPPEQMSAPSKEYEGASP